MAVALLVSGHFHMMFGIHAEVDIAIIRYLGQFERLNFDDDDDE